MRDGVDVEGTRVRFHRDHTGAGARDREPSGDIGIRGHDDLVALADTEGLQGQVHGIEPIRHTDAVSGAAEAGVRLLESSDFLAEDEAPRIVEGLEVTDDLIPQPLVEVIQ